MNKRIIELLKDIKVTGLNSNYVKNDNYKDSELVSMYDIYKYQTECKELQDITKANKPAIQNNVSGVRLLKNNTKLNGIPTSYYDYWDGLVFIDIDNKIRLSKDEVHKCKSYLHAMLSSFHWYLWTTTSASDNGIHIICYFPARFHSESEYLTSASIAYSRVSSILAKYLKDNVKNLIENGIVDLHNYKDISHVFKFTYGETLVNENFDPGKILAKGFSSDIEYRSYAIESNAISREFASELNKLDCNVVNMNIAPSHSIPENISTNSNGDILNFKYDDRLQLVYTLMNYYSPSDTYIMCDQLYKVTNGTDTKYSERMKEIKSIIASYKDQKPNYKYVRILKETYGIQLDYYVEISNDVMIPADAITLKINNSQYLSDVMPDVLSNLGDITILDSPAASGKTTAIATLQENLIMTEPYTAIIKNKIEQNPALSNYGCLYEKRRITDEKYTNTKKFCCTPNNLINISSEELLTRNIKYVFVDESHTIISDASYRLDVMGKFLNTLENYVSAGIKVILMTATTLDEMSFFKVQFPHITTKYIKVERDKSFKKELTVKRYATSDDRKSALYNDIAQALADGYKCIVPTNAGDKVVEGMLKCIKERVAHVETLKILSEQGLSTYYTRKNRFQNSNEKITESSNIEEINLVFAGTSFGVGLDINYTGKVKVFFPDLIPVYNIEQFASRLRKTDKDCYLYVDYENHQHMDWTSKASSKPHTELDFNYAKSVVELANQQNLFSCQYMIEENIINCFPFISYDYKNMKYYVDEQSWALSVKSHEIETYCSQLSVIKNICQNRYGFAINDDRNILSVEETVKTADEASRQSAYMERSLKIYQAACEILENESFVSEASLYHTAKEETDSIKQVVFNDIIYLLDNKVPAPCIQSILSDCLDHKKMKYSSSIMSSIKNFAKLYCMNSYRSNGTIEEYIQKYRDFVIVQNQKCRRETLAEFIGTLEEEAKNDARVKDDNFISDLTKAILKKEKDCSKTKTYLVTIRDFANDLFDNTGVRIEPSTCSSQINLFDI